MKFNTLDDHPTTEAVPVNDSVQRNSNSNLNNDNQQNKDENSAATESDGITKTESNESSQSTCINDGTNEPQVYNDSIRIRLKYLNDNCRLVEGRLHENIGIFKRYCYQYLIIIILKILIYYEINN